MCNDRTTQTQTCKQEWQIVTLDSGTWFFHPIQCTASTVKAMTICANRLHCNFHSFLKKYPLVTHDPNMLKKVTGNLLGK